MDDSRRYPERPILGVGAIVAEGGRVLLVERGRAPLEGSWSLPGGEVFERIMPDDRGRTEYHYVSIDYLCGVTGGELCAASDAAQARWAAPCELASYRMTEGTLAVIRKALES